MTPTTGKAKWQCARCGRELSSSAEGVACPTCRRVVCPACTVAIGAARRRYCRDCVVRIPEAPDKP